MGHLDPRIADAVAPVSRGAWRTHQQNSTSRGATDDIVKAPRSYTDAFLAPVLAKAGKPKKRRTDEAAE
jgi:hypothetical protein